MKIRIGTRSSPLALKQTDLVIQALTANSLIYEYEIVPIKTTGDIIQDRPLADVGGKALFAKEIEGALIKGKIDFAVHSLKDMESTLPYPLEITAVLPRELPYDVLISREGKFLEDLPEKSIIGSCSPRRSAQLLVIRPDFKIAPIRGNIQTRLSLLDAGKYDAIILAEAGLRRLGLKDRITQRFPINTMIPAIGQGVIGIECRKDDIKIKEILAAINHSETYYRILAERSLLKALEGTCRTPIAGYASLLNDGMIHLTGFLANETAAKMVHYEEIGHDPIALGENVAAALREKLLI